MTVQRIRQFAEIDLNESSLGVVSLLCLWRNEAAVPSIVRLEHSSLVERHNPWRGSHRRWVLLLRHLSYHLGACSHDTKRASVNHVDLKAAILFLTVSASILPVAPVTTSTWSTWLLSSSLERTIDIKVYRLYASSSKISQRVSKNRSIYTSIEQSNFIHAERYIGKHVKTLQVEVSST